MVNLLRRKSPETQNAVMQTRLQCEARNCRISVCGRITIDSSPSLRVLLLESLSSSDCEDLTVDLDEVLYVDTSCVAVLLETLKEARAQKKAFRLSGVDGHARFLLEATRILNLFNEPG
jgi:anti-sigma B factor antagonist